MNGRIRTVIASFLTVLLIGSFANAQITVDEAQQNGITIATANEIPYGWIEGGEAMGIAPDVAEAVLANMGIEDIEWVQTEFGALIPGLVANRFDMAAASQAILPERCEQVIYAKVNSSYGEGLLVQSGNPEDIHGYQDLADNQNLTVGIVSGADQIDFLHAYGIPDTRIRQFQSNTDALSAVASGRIDAYAATGLTVQRLAMNSDRVEAATPFEDPVVDGEPVRSFGSFTFNPGAEEFRDAFNEALAEFQETDEYRETLKSHGLSDQDVDAALAADTEQLCSGE